jgi:hypothetical protein
VRVRGRNRAGGLGVLSRPYERPPLSKDYLRGESDREDAFVHEQGFGPIVVGSRAAARAGSRWAPGERGGVPDTSNYGTAPALCASVARSGATPSP